METNTRDCGRIDEPVGRRTFLKAAGLATVAGPALATARRGAAQSGVDLTDWFATVSNYDGVVDERGSETVTVAVGAKGNGGGFAFGPAAVRVDPGTTVVWEWVGEDGPHKFVEEDGEYASPRQSSGQYALRFDGVGVSRYGCEPHLPRGMKGAVVVGDVFEGVHELTTTELSVLGVYGVAIGSPVAFGAFLWLRDRLRARAGTE